MVLCQPRTLGCLYGIERVTYFLEKILVPIAIPIDNANCLTIFDHGRKYVGINPFVLEAVA